ncbi:MAG: tRNA pseudouridine(38-40) synthase TruA [Nocardioidaceae bacterium]
MTARLRVRLDIAYDGTQFSGWARQPERRTVQGELEQTLSQVLRSERTPLTCAGRTDAGVHARGQVCHVDVPGSTDVAQLERRLARALPADLRVRRVRPVPDDFDARFSASWRRYVYRISDDPASADPLRRAEVLTWRRALDADTMSSAGEQLLGEHDFAAFCRRRIGATTIRTLLRLSTERTVEGLLETTVVADAFCHSMVRALMGALTAVGDGRLAVDQPARILAGGVRDPRVTVLAAHGLTLEEVGYPPAGELADRARRSRALRTLAGTS